MSRMAVLGFVYARSIGRGHDRRSPNPTDAATTTITQIAPRSLSASGNNAAARPAAAANAAECDQRFLHETSKKRRVRRSLIVADAI